MKIVAYELKEQNRSPLSWLSGCALIWLTAVVFWWGTGVQKVAVRPDEGVNSHARGRLADQALPIHSPYPSQQLAPLGSLKLSAAEWQADGQELRPAVAAADLGTTFFYMPTVQTRFWLERAEFQFRLNRRHEFLEFVWGQVGGRRIVSRFTSDKILVFEHSLDHGDRPVTQKTFRKRRDWQVELAVANHRAIIRFGPGRELIVPVSHSMRGAIGIRSNLTPDSLKRLVLNGSVAGAHVVKGPIMAKENSGTHMSENIITQKFTGVVR
jgi:hypothetical protein